MGQSDADGPDIVTGNSFTDAGASTDTAFVYRVHAVDAYGNVSQPAATASATRPVPAPITVPSGVTIEPRDGQTTVSWAYPGDPEVDGYYVYRQHSTNEAWTRLTTNVVSTTQFADTEAPAGVSYYYVASVTREGAESAPSTVVSVERITPTTPTPPLAPQIRIAAPYTLCTADDCTPHGGPRIPVTLTMLPNAAEPDRKPAGYLWRIFGGGQDSGYQKVMGDTITWTPSMSGYYRVDMFPLDVYGRSGTPVTISFKVA
ncbi:hypothetical protein [Streptomyces sp. NPDC059909]|uniref:hypothetical protein n=1 Tax=Streptomyces sp. NPDC059909 TaxID=3346998 RepID=UPI00364AC3F9